MISLIFSNIVCIFVVYVVGFYEVKVVVLGKGRVLLGFFFEYSLIIISVSLNESGFGGGCVFLF